MLKYSAEHYVRLKNTYLTEGVEGSEMPDGTGRR